MGLLRDWSYRPVGGRTRTTPPLLAREGPQSVFLPVGPWKEGPGDESGPIFGKLWSKQAKYWEIINSKWEIFQTKTPTYRESGVIPGH